MAEYLEANKQEVIKLVLGNKSYHEISSVFKRSFPEVKRGFSERNIRLFCSNHGIKRLAESQVDVLVNECVCEVSLEGIYFDQMALEAYKY